MSWFLWKKRKNLIDVCMSFNVSIKITIQLTYTHTQTHLLFVTCHCDIKLIKEIILSFVDLCFFNGLYGLCVMSWRRKPFLFEFFFAEKLRGTSVEWLDCLRIHKIQQWLRDFIGKLCATFDVDLLRVVCYKFDSCFQTLTLALFS